jgi:transglutaminase-like putative cysteine protease
VQNSNSVIESVERIFNFVTENIEYDFELAETVRSGYIPDVDLILERGKGICFDYAALMTAMLRSQGIPTKLVIGYVGELRHAWISVHTEEAGWINNIIRFEGNWRILDPTFAASSNQIGDENYNATHFH